MPLYERRDDAHEVVERIRTVEGSREDRRLVESGAWKRIDEESTAAVQPQEPTPAPAARRTTKPATSEG